MLSILAAVMVISIPSGHGLTRGGSGGSGGSGGGGSGGSGGSGGGGSGGSGGSGRVSTADSIAKNTVGTALSMLKCLTFVMAKDYQDFVDDECTKLLGATHLDNTFWNIACVSTGCTACVAGPETCTACKDGYLLESAGCTACTVSGCKECYNATECKTCEEGYRIDFKRRTCY